MRHTLGVELAGYGGGILRLRRLCRLRLTGCWGGAGAGCNHRRRGDGRLDYRCRHFFCRGKPL